MNWLLSVFSLRRKLKITGDSWGLGAVKMTTQFTKTDSHYSRLKPPQSLALISTVAICIANGNHHDLS